MNKKLYLLVILYLCLTKISVIADVDADLSRRIADTNDKSPFSILDSPDLQGERLDAMKFLYAYMLLPDLTAHDANFWLANVDASLQARREMPWGNSVQQREWLHFVLPVRVNNEALDSARPIFYKELRDRVKHLSMQDAILEVNHWCHEKASYQPSDSRTSTPLSTVTQAIGRCGEESTLAVAALRSVGIPARQVYTPRWAHTDDNHAWVEAWADGKWHFIGACEPEPILDLAWFNAPASRGLLMTTNVFGNYDGPEEKLKNLETTTVINVTPNYAPTGVSDVKVVDTKGKPVPNANVSFCIYNYSEFYPAVTKTADKNGHASLCAGLGDLIIWATDGNSFGFTKANPVQKDTAVVVLDKTSKFKGIIDLDIMPPAQSATLPQATEQQRELNNRRLAAEDAVRNYYISTFASDTDAYRLARPLGMDEERTAGILTIARGNSRRLMDFFITCPDSLRPKALDLLESLAEKDCRDIDTSVLWDNLLYTPESSDSLYYVDYILNPRVSSEHLTPYKKFFTYEIPVADRLRYCNNPQEWVEYVRNTIKIDNSRNPQKVAMTPQGVWGQKTADNRSINLFFVASARALGIPARIDPITGKTQYINNVSKEWTDVSFENNTRRTARAGKGNIILKYTPDAGRNTEPRYYSQFSIFKIENGTPSRLDFDDTATVSEVSGQLSGLDCGQYMLITGQRMADGTVLAHIEFLTLDKGKTVTLPVNIRHDDTRVEVSGSLNAENIYHDLTEDRDKSILSHTGRGYFIVGLIAPGNEPTAHALNDISALKSEFEAMGTPLLLLFTDADAAARFNASPYTSLPENARFGIDLNGKSMADICDSLSLSDVTMPKFIIADSFNRIVFLSEGYTIGLGETLLKTLAKINQ